ncbi:MAG: acetyl-CoA carboxylase biotin carboxyl carrier protein [Candidatus Muiribacteriota bacterium]
MDDSKKLKAFFDIFSQNGLSRLYYKNKDFEINLEKKDTILKEVNSEGLLKKKELEKMEPEEKIVPEKPHTNKKYKEIKSPIHGNFYRASSPEAKPFVEIGDVIKEGQVVCIIESMKVMNEIKSSFSGKVSDILLDNASPVLKDQALILVE